MRLGPILVPAAIVVAIGVIVAAQAGWLDANGPEPVMAMRSVADIHRSPESVAEQRSVQPQSTARSATAAPTVAEPTSVGRSVGKAPDDRASFEADSRGSGGAGLDADGVASAAAAPSSPVGSAPSDDLQQARADAAKAKQDVLDVTQASVEAQRASEAEFERQKAELTAQIAQLRQAAAAQGDPAKDDTRTEALAAELDRARQEAATLKQRLVAATPDAVVQAEAKAATASAELADARERENALRAKLAALPPPGGAHATETAASEKAAEDRIAAGERTLAEEKSRSKALADKVAALETEVGAKADTAERAATLEHELSQSQAQAKALSVRVGDLQADLAAGRTAMAPLAVKAADADRLQQDLASSRRQQDALTQQVAALTIKAGQVAALQTRLEAQSSASTPDATAKTADTAQLQEALAGARRGEDTLRKENGVLQSELAAAQATGKLLGEKLAALQVGAGQPVPTVPPTRRNRAKVSQAGDEHSRLVRQLDELKAEQLRQELHALDIEATDMARAHRGRRSRTAGEQGAHFVAVLPTDAQHPSAGERRATRRRDKAAAHEREATADPASVLARPSRASARRRPDADGSSPKVAEATRLMRAGHVDQARELLRQDGGLAASRLLTDSYAAQFGALGVSTDGGAAASLE